MTDAPSAPAIEAPAPAAPAKGGGMIRSSMIYSFFTLLSRVMGFLRDLVVTYFMGASATFAADAFNAAFAFPNLFRRIFAEGAFAAAFVPAYSKSLEQDGEEIADVLAADAMATLAAATLALTVFAELTMPWLMRWLIAPGFAANPQKLELAILLTRITMPYLPCMAIYAHLSGVLNARNRFILSAAAPILLNVWTLVTVLPSHSPQQASILAAAGVLVAGVSQAALLWWGVRRSGARVDVRWPRLTPEIRKLIMLAVPGAIAASATQINIFISGILVSQVNGARSWLAVCDRLYQLPQGLVGVAVGVALLPRLSRAVHAGDKPQARGAIDQAIVFCMALALPCAVGLVAIPYFLIDALYTRGAFTHADALKTALALQQYGWGVPAFVIVQITNRIFFAQQDTRTPMVYGLVSVGVNVLLGVTLFYLVGVPGIAAATSAAWWLNVLMMNVHLARKGVYMPGPAAISKLGRILAANVALGLILWAAGQFRPQIQAALQGASLGHAKELAILAVVSVAGVAYPVLLLLSGGITRAELKAAVRRGG
ncbi:murein biosynthesis integral membrane protein MurJ [Caulobacter sp. KR2-114]|uniref:murein biosynthesis integral membrane protein MurJ n=1 Tax=Caulobacter sp. KR2-114 TaxID=3400912 RepID=UPI003C0B933A